MLTRSLELTTLLPLEAKKIRNHIRMQALARNLKSVYHAVMNFGIYLKQLAARNSAGDDGCGETELPSPPSVTSVNTASPVVAYFDLDHTLIDGYSLTALALQHLLNGKISLPRLCRLSFMYLKYFLGRIDYDQMLRATVDDIRGMPEEELSRLGEQAFQTRLAQRIYVEGFKLINTHKQLGHDVVMVTAATSYQARPIARALGIDNICSTGLEIEEGKVNGVVNTCYGQGKVEAAVAYAQQVGTELSAAYFYSDSREDLPLLELVGNPVVVNAKARLIKIAQVRGWPILQFVQKGIDSSSPNITQRVT